MAPPTSRLGRLARLTALAPRALPVAAEAVKRALGRTRTEEEERQSREKLVDTAKKTAEQMLKTLGEMKGLPLKFGQMASYIDGLAPPGYEEKFQEVLKKLQAKAPPLSREAAIRVIESELGEPPSTLFDVFEIDPFAAASIGQVHRARTRGGDWVAVKVQYPGIDTAIENDLKSLGLLESMIAPMGRRYQTKETLDEIRSVFQAELDYRKEAAMLDAYRRIFEGDDDVVIPRHYPSLSSRRVLTTELLGGKDYNAFTAGGPTDETRAAAETVWRFMFRPLFVHGSLYADPHPGNYRFLGSARVGFLDFGCVRLLPKDLIEGVRRYIRAAQEGDWDEFYRACVEVLGYDPADEQGFRLYTEYTKYLLEPMTTDGAFLHTKERAREAVGFLVRGGKDLVFKSNDALPHLPKPIRMPIELTFANRLQWGLSSILAGLGGESNWRKLTWPWLREPIAPLKLD
jgi:predicted unusual protein kinase regulating ubiquinone biosynthesis (AarF/ABC1/UbiB family)